MQEKLLSILGLATSRRFLVSMAATALIFFAKDIFKFELTQEQAVEYLDKALIALTIIASTFNIGTSIREHK